MATNQRPRPLSTRISENVDDAVRAWAEARNLHLAVAVDQLLGAALGVYSPLALHAPPEAFREGQAAPVLDPEAVG